MASAVAPKIIWFSFLNSRRKEGFEAGFGKRNFGVKDRHGSLTLKCGIERSSNGSDGKKGGVSNSNYVVPLDNSSPFSNSSCITRPLAEILRDLNKRIPDTIVKAHVPGDPSASTFIPWYFSSLIFTLFVTISLDSNADLIQSYHLLLFFARYHANRMLSFYAPGACLELSIYYFCLCETSSITVYVN